jgi:hypothetical protein
MAIAPCSGMSGSYAPIPIPPRTPDAYGALIDVIQASVTVERAIHSRSACFLGEQLTDARLWLCSALKYIDNAVMMGGYQPVQAYRTMAGYLVYAITQLDTIIASTPAESSGMIPTYITATIVPFLGQLSFLYLNLQRLLLGSA